MSVVELMQNDDCVFVRKTGDVSRNIERFDALSRLNISLPKIIEIYGDSYDMEYVQHQDIKTYLLSHSANDLIQFITNFIEILSNETFEKDYSEIYKNKLSKFPWAEYNLPFDFDKLFEVLPKRLPASEYHGDLTLENILYKITNNSFILIDPLTTEYDSYVFDLAKLRQDLDCKWFIRNERYYFDSKLKTIKQELSKHDHFNNDYLLILMLMRVLPYTKNEKDKLFLENEIRKLWK